MHLAIRRKAKSQTFRSTTLKTQFRAGLEPLESRALLAAITWNIIQAESFASVAIPDQPFEIDDMGTIYTGTLRVRNQGGQNSGPWNVGNSAQIAGTIATDYVDGSSIQFLLGQSNMTGVNSGSYIPDPANWNGIDFGGNFAAGPGVYGGRLYPSVDQILFGIPITAGYFNFSNVQYDLGSVAPLAITAGSFPANTTEVGMASALASLKGAELLGELVLDDAQEPVVNLLATNQAATATITSPDPINQPDLRRLTFPILQNFSLEISPGAPPFTGTITGQMVAETTLPPPGSIAGRHLFYNQSAFDGSNASINAADSSAIASDKTAYLPGSGTATFASVSSFSRGINGIMIDLAGGGNHAAITASDFVFKVGNNNSPADWAAAPAPSAVAVSLGAGVGGSDRVTVTWANGAIDNQWLEVQVLANANTGLAADDVHFWGNKIADSGTGTPATTFTTNSTDATQVFATLSNPATGGITNLRDYNRSNSVNSTDASIVFANLGSITRINIPAGGPFAPEGDGDGGGDPSAVTSALAAADSGEDASPQAARIDGPPATRDDGAPLRRFYELLGDANDPRASLELDAESESDVGDLLGGSDGAV